jgi:hypothetical protein
VSSSTRALPASIAAAMGLEKKEARGLLSS